MREGKKRRKKVIRKGGRNDGMIKGGEKIKEGVCTLTVVTYLTLTKCCRICSTCSLHS